MKVLKEKNINSIPEEVQYILDSHIKFCKEIDFSFFLFSFWVVSLFLLDIKIPNLMILNNFHVVNISIFQKYYKCIYS